MFYNILFQSTNINSVPNMGKTLLEGTKAYRDKTWFFNHTHLCSEKGPKSAS